MVTEPEAEDYERECRCGVKMPLGGDPYPKGWSSARNGRSFCVACVAKHVALKEKYQAEARKKMARQKRLPSFTPQKDRG